MKLVIRRRLPWFVAGASLVLVSVGASLCLIYILRTGDAQRLISHQGLVPLITLSYALLGALVASRHPRNVIGWLYLAAAILYGLLAAAVGANVYNSLGRSGGLTWLDWLYWLGWWAWVPALILPFSFALPLFPDGRLLSRRWRLLVGLTGVGLAGTVLGLALHPGPIETWNMPGVNPLGIPGAGPLLEPLLNASATMLALSMLGALAAVGLRFHRSQGVEREQLKWVVYTAVVLFLLLGLASALAPVLLSEPAATDLSILLTDLFILGIAVSVSVAILRHRLYDIDLVINRTLVYGLLTAAIVGGYALIVGGLGVVFQAQGSLALSLVGVGIVAIVVQPARDRLQRAVNRLMYGERDDPYAVLSRLGQRLEGTLAPESVLPSLVETVAQTLKLPYAAIALSSASDSSGSLETFPIVAAYGSPSLNSLRLPLVYQGETIGALIVGPRAGDAFSIADRRLLDDLARQAGVAVHAVRLTADLQRSREQLVAAREEERRRLRRDLHDGLGSQLAALHLRADTARALIPENPATAEAVLVELRDELRAAVADIRRVVYELRPPALDELGLAGALHALAARSTSADGLRVNVEAPESLPPLTAAAEVAAYRIAQEALTNVARHARARTCVIRLDLADCLQLEIRDDGLGLPPQAASGVGLRSMRERAEELGGSCCVEAQGVAGGTRVTARLPLLHGVDRARESPAAQAVN
jgi:signal transduction histidine kinase